MGDQKNVILVVDDEPVNLKTLVTFLEDESFRVDFANNGEEALQAVKQSLPDLILLDVMMPGLDGLEVCRQFKDNKLSMDIPVIFITALAQTSDKVAGFQAGGVDYITKPFNKVEVLARVNTHITLRKREKELAQALAEVKRLSGIIPICSSCKSIRNDAGYWQQVDHYIANHSEAVFSHGLCVQCLDKLYGAEEWYRAGKGKGEKGE